MLCSRGVIIAFTNGVLKCNCIALIVLIALIVFVYLTYYSLTLSEKANSEYGFRSLEREVEKLKDDLQQCEFQKEALIRENRRLQDDLSSAAKDCITARRELEIEKQDVENLKKQLQQYVAEVKKAEELLTKKGRAISFFFFFSKKPERTIAIKSFTFTHLY